MEKSDMKQCQRLRQDTELVTCTEFLRMKSLDTTCFKTLEVVSWFHTSDGSVHSPDPKLLAYQMPMPFSKEHVIY